MATTLGTPQTTEINVEFWFRLLYECLHGGCYGGADLSVAKAFLATLWIWISWIGYIVALAAIFVIVYTTVRLFELRHREHEIYEDFEVAAPERAANPRWAHIEALGGSQNPAEWRQAIIEADIMLDEMLSRQGYRGSGVGEKLKGVEPADFDTLNDAWEAHKVRNQIAHEGSAFDLSETLAKRTLARYEAVFREFELV